MNSSEYLTAFENFIMKLQQLSEADPARISEAMAELCRILRLGKVEVVIYENPAAERLGPSAVNCFYDSGKASEIIFISKRNIAIDDKLIVYNIYSIAEETEWTQEEREKIDIFIATFSTFNEKFRLAGLTYHITYYDSDLDMYNLKQFMRSVSILCNTRRIAGNTALRIDLKRFSTVNQYIGRENGTMVMKKFVKLLDSILDKEKNELICRLGGDNFLMLIKNETLPAVLDILKGRSIVYDEIHDERILISANAGVYEIKDTDRPIVPTEIMDRISLTAQLAKNSSDTDVVYFDDALLARIKRNDDISVNFMKAIAEREFLVYYQPKVSVHDRHIAGAEALCRWEHDGRMIPPGEFIPFLEQGRDICKLDFYMLDTVCRDIRRWLDSGKNVVRISVNLSRRHLSDTDLLKHILEIVDRNQVPHEYIEIELTETTTEVEFQDLKRIIQGLQKSGISTSVDDFGIGYSSLNLIKEIPWNVLKLDKSLLPAEGDENLAQKGVMFKYIVAMTQAMGLECISEGVETKEQVELLAENSCNLAQGFYFDKPLPLEEFEKRLDKNYIYNR